MRKTVGVLVTVVTFFCLIALPMTVVGDETGYRSPEEINRALDAIAGQAQVPAEVLTLCETPGGRELKLLALGREKAEQPAVFVIANMEGNCPIASEAALKLGELVAAEWTEERDAYKWYIVPLGNPDGHHNFFAQPLVERFINERPINDDNDDATDEDGFEDLNADGFITMMRQRHPEGRWMAIEGNPVLMKKADKAKGEQGVWRLFSEGIDNDGDGDINEDGPGGANPGRNFPHNFEHYVPSNGPWAASEIESRSILRFAFDHPDIAMFITLGRSNSLKSVPESSRKAEGAGGKYKVPERWANRLGLEPDKEYPIDELLDLARDFTGYQELTEDQLLQWLGVGAAVNPDKNDIPYWKEISERYNEFIKEAELDAERLDPPGFSDGCVDEWAYYQYGVPSFSVDFWTLPKKKEEKRKNGGGLTPDEIEKMSNDDFIALGNEKIDSLLKASGAPAQFTVEMVIKGFESGRMTTKRIAKFLREAAEKDDEDGADETELALYAHDSTAFVPWQTFDHPTLGSVEIGGQIAFRDLTPPNDQVDELLDKQLPFLRQLVALLPRISIEDVKIESKSPGVWKVEVWIANNGFLPYPTHQGQRCERPTPAAVTVTGEQLTFLEGRERTVLGLLDGSGGTQKVNYLIGADAGDDITIEVYSPSTSRDTRTITLSGGSGQ